MSKAKSQQVDLLKCFNRQFKGVDNINTNSIALALVALNLTVSLNRLAIKLNHTACAIFILFLVQKIVMHIPKESIRYSFIEIV